jgi:ribosomal protein L25 (general stress protein Ctc)
MYHFDYLTLLLTGIFDAQAKIATVVYGIGGDKRHVSFRNEGFLKALQKHCISELYEVVTNDKCEQLMVMLHTLRNTIHHAGLTTTRARTAGRERSLIEVPDALQEDLWQAAVALGEPDEWGVTREEYRLLDVPTGQTSQKVRVSIEPYSYATRLVSEWFSLINQVANATEVEKLFSGKTMPELSREPPTDWHEYPRFSVLG